MTYRRIRDDFHEHPRTRGLSLLARDVFWQCVTASILGVSQRSTRQLARRASSPDHTVTDADVSAALAELESRDLAVWWPELEILWVVEAMDENLDNDKAKSAAIGAAECLPPEVVDRIADRYPWIVKSQIRRRNTLFRQEKEQDQETEQEQEGTSARRQPPQIRIVGRDADPILDALNAALGVSITADQHGRFYVTCAERVADGALAHDEIGPLIQAWQRDTDASRVDRRRLFYGQNWKWTRKRYLEGVPTEAPAVALAVEQPSEPVEKMSSETLAKITAGLTAKLAPNSKRGSNE